MMKLDPKGLEAAREQPGTNHEAIIRAYIEAIMPMKVSGLVERLRQYEGRSWETTHCYNGTRDEAAISIENLSAGLATVWRNKLEAEDALASERAAHAETKRERDEFRDIAARKSNQVAGLIKTEAAQRLAGARVVTLEWRGTEGVWAKADALFGATYRITEYAGMAKPFKLETVDFVGPHGHYGTLDDAKAAAQSDYERRILSALAEPAGEAEPRQFLPTEDGEFNGDTDGNTEETPIAAEDGREVDWVDVTGWGVFKGHAIPVDVARYIATKINLYAEHRTAPPDASAIRGAAELARACLAGLVSAGHNFPSPKPEQIETAFWALDAALTGAKP